MNEASSGKFVMVFNSGPENQSYTGEFILEGLTDSPELQTLLFFPFLFTYITALVANILLIFIIYFSKRLHSPMYFLLINLSLVNVLSISTTVPKLLHNLWTYKKTISFHGCMAQVYFFIWFLATELTLLTFMGVDRYAAICHPLQYTIIMRKEVCILIAVASWLIGLIDTSVNFVFNVQLSFCQSNIIDHFFCDIPPLLKLTCSDMTLNKTMLTVADMFFGIGCGGLTLMSYGFILRAIFKIKSSEGKKKAFSTCSSHLTVVTLYYSSVIYTYIRPNLDSSASTSKHIVLLYTVVTPVINPVIYSLRNKEVKEALKILTGKCKLIPRNQD